MAKLYQPLYMWNSAVGVSTRGWQGGFFMFHVIFSAMLRYKVMVLMCLSVLALIVGCDGQRNALPRDEGQGERMAQEDPKNDNDTIVLNVEDYEVTSWCSQYGVFNIFLTDSVISRKRLREISNPVLKIYFDGALKMHFDSAYGLFNGYNILSAILPPCDWYPIDEDGEADIVENELHIRSCSLSRAKIKALTDDECPHD